MVMNNRLVFGRFLAVMPVALVVMGLAVTLPAYSLDRNAQRTVLKNGAIGAGTGLILGGVSERQSAVKGALWGAATGAGAGVIRSSDRLENRPILRNTATGAILGTGVSGATGRSKVKGAVVGAGAGAATQVVRNWWEKR